MLCVAGAGSTGGPGRNGACAVMARADRLVFGTNALQIRPALGGTVKIPTRTPWEGGGWWVGPSAEVPSRRGSH